MPDKAPPPNPPAKLNPPVSDDTRDLFEMDLEHTLKVQRHYAILARRLAARAAHLQENADRQKAADAFVSGLEALPAAVQSLVQGGREIDQAVRSVAAQYGVPVETVITHMHRARRDQEAKARQSRDAMILRAYWRGESNPEIAAKAGVSVATVKRTIAEALRKARRNVAPDR
jgi:DNA-directed RNA polymerase specialized sigma24 family protein